MPHPWKHLKSGQMWPWEIWCHWRCPCPLQMSLIRWSLKIPSNPNNSTIPKVTVWRHSWVLLEIYGSPLLPLYTLLSSCLHVPQIYEKGKHNNQCTLKTSTDKNDQKLIGHGKEVCYQSRKFNQLVELSYEHQSEADHATRSRAEDISQASSLQHQWTDICSVVQRAPSCDPSWAEACNASERSCSPFSYFYLYTEIPKASFQLCHFPAQPYKHYQTRKRIGLPPV